VFLGEYEHSLDAKGRVILPAKFRAQLEDGCVLTKGQDNCLEVYPRDEWERRVARLKEAQRSSLAARNFMRMFFSGASDDGPDKQGRLSIPESLRRYAGLERDVVVAGTGGTVEIWDSGRWAEHMRSTEPAYSQIDQSASEFTF
jgi:MraZ protein